MALLVLSFSSLSQKKLLSFLSEITLYRCEDRAHGQPCMIYGNKDTDSLKGRAGAERQESTSRWISDCGTRANETTEVKGRSNCQILKSLFFPMKNHAIGQIHFLATRTVHKLCLFLRI